MVRSHELPAQEFYVKLYDTHRCWHNSMIYAIYRQFLGFQRRESFHVTMAVHFQAVNVVGPPTKETCLLHFPPICRIWKMIYEMKWNELSLMHKDLGEVHIIWLQSRILNAFLPDMNV